MRSMIGSEDRPPLGPKYRATGLPAILFAIATLLGISSAALGQEEAALQNDGDSHPPLTRGALITGGSNIKHVGHALIDGFFVEVGGFLYQQDKIDSEVDYSGILVGLGAERLSAETDMQCWSPLKFKLFETDDERFRILELAPVDCSIRGDIPDQIILIHDEEFGPVDTEIDLGPVQVSRYFGRGIYRSINSDLDFVLYLFDDGHPEWVRPSFNSTRVALGDQLIGEGPFSDGGYRPFEPDTACAFVPRENRDEYAQRLRRMEEVWWFNNAFTVNAAKMAYYDYHSEGGLAFEAATAVAHNWSVARSGEILNLTDFCVDPHYTDLEIDDETELFQIRSFPFQFSRMLKQLSQLGTGNVFPMYYATAGGTPRDFFEIGKRNVTDENANLEANRLEEVLYDALEMALRGTSETVEILRDHPFRVPFAYRYQISGYGGEITGDATRWERLVMEVGISPSYQYDYLGNRYNSYVASVSFPITAVRTWPRSPSPANMIDGFTEVTDDPSVKDFLLRVEGHICIITSCGLAVARLDDIEHEWIE